MAQIEMRLLGRAAKYLEARSILEQILEDVDLLGVDHVVLSGDLTTLATDEEFEMVRQALGPLAREPGRLTVLPGNHDRYTPGSMREARFERHFGEHLACDLSEYRGGSPFPMVRLLGEHLAIVALDSTMVPAFPGLAYGRVGRRQLDALRGILSDIRMRNRRVLVSLHHGPYTRTGRPDLPSHGLRDARALLDLCREAGVSALLHGHMHDRYHLVCPHSGVPIFSGGSSTETGREGYWLFDLDEDGLQSAESMVPGSASDAGEACCAVAS